MFAALKQRYERLVREREDALEAHREWIRQEWPAHVRAQAVEGRAPTASEIIADGDAIGWVAWGDPNRSRARYEPIRESFEARRVEDLRQRLEAIQ